MAQSTKNWTQTLQELKVSNFLESNFKLVHVTENDTVATLFEVLESNGVNSVLVYDTKTKSYAGFIDRLDLAIYCVAKFSKVQLLAWDTFRQEKEFASTLVKDLVDISSRNPWVPVKPSASLFDLLSVMAKGNTHRVPVVNDNNEVVGVISQLKVLSFLTSERPNLGEFGKRKVKKWLPPNDDAYVVYFGDNVIESFSAVWEKSIHGVGVVDDQGALIGNFSETDLHRSRPGDMISSLYKPLKDFINLRLTTEEKVKSAPTNSNRPVSCTLDSTTEEVLDLFNQNQVRRVYVIDDQKKPIAVISCVDLIRALGPESQ